MVQHPLQYLWKELKITLGVAIILLTVFYAILRLSVPYISEALPGLNYWAEYQLQTPARIGKLSIVWEGSKPAIRLSDVALLDESRTETLLHAKQVDIIINPLDSLVNGRFRIDTVWIEEATTRFDFRTLSASETSIDDISKESSMLFQDDPAWVKALRDLPIQWVVLNKANIHLIDASGRSWPFSDVHATVVRNDETLRVRASTKLLGGKPAAFRLMADIDEVFDAPTGVIYTAGDGFDLERLVDYFPNASVARTSEGDLSYAFWTTLESGDLGTVFGEIEAKNVRVGHDQDMDDFFPVLKGRVQWRDLGADAWRFIAHDIQVEDETNPWKTSALQLEYHTRTGQPAFDLRAEDLQVDMWVPFLVRTEWLPDTIQHALSAYEPGGLIRYLDAGFVLFDDKEPWYSVQFAGDNLRITQPDVGYHFDGLSLRISLDDASGFLLFESPSLAYHALDAPQIKLHLDEVAGQIHWMRDDGLWTVHGLQHHARIGEGWVFGDYSAQIAPGSGVNDMSWWLRAEQIPVSDLMDYWPLAAQDLDVHQWLDRALIDGRFSEVRWVYRGDGRDLSAPMAAHEARIDMDNLTIDYQKPWPAISNINGAITLQGKALSLDTTHAKMGSEVPVLIQGVIPDVDNDDQQLFLDAQMNGDIRQVGPLLHPTKFGPTLGDGLVNANATGPFDLGLKLTIPLQHTDDTSIRGLFALQDVDAHIDAFQPIHLAHLKGDIQFTDEYLNLDGLTGIWLGTPFVTDMQARFSGENPRLQVSTKSELVMKDVLAWAQASDLPLKGRTPYTIRSVWPLNDDDEGGFVALQTTLEGVEIDAPEPLGKSAEVERPFEFKIHLDEPQHVGLSAHLGSNISFVERLQLTDSGWQPAGAHLHFGEQSAASYPNEEIFLIDGFLPTLDVGAWMQWYDELGLKTSESAQTDSALEPQIELTADTWRYKGIVFPKNTVSAWPDGRRWIVELEGQNADGRIVIPSSERWHQTPIRADFEHFTLPDQFGGEDDPDGPHPISVVEEPTVDTHSWPLIEAHCKALRWRGTTFRQFKAHAVPRPAGYAFIDVSATGKPVEFSLTGYWDFLLSPEATNLTGWFRSEDFGHFLRASGLETAIRDARAELKGQLHWLGGASPDFNTLNGDLEFELRKGRVVGVEPGIGRILALLSLSNIARRLTFNFADLTKEGFFFDKISGRFLFDREWVIMRDIALKGPIANIDFKGRFKLADPQTIDTEMNLKPNVSETLPLAAAIASGNPAVGAALWVFNKAVGSEMEEIVRYRYAITGTLTAPEIEELEVIREKKKSS